MTWGEGVVWRGGNASGKGGAEEVIRMKKRIAILQESVQDKRLAGPATKHLVSDKNANV
jgi:hypothetical protein